MKRRIATLSSPERLEEIREWCRENRQEDESCEERKRTVTRAVLNAWANYLKERVLEEVSLENINLKASNFDKHLIRPEIVGFAAWKNGDFVSDCETKDSQTVTSLY